MPSRDMIVAIAGGSGFIGGAIVRRLLGAGFPVRLLTRNPDRAQQRFGSSNIEFFRSDLTDPRSLRVPLAGVGAIINAAQFDGYPVENPRRGLTFERVDYGGTCALIEMADHRSVTRFVYISGASASPTAAHPAFRAKGRAESALRNSGIPFTIFRPSLAYGPGDRVIAMFAQMLRLSPLCVIPGDGRQRVQPLMVDDLAECVVRALEERHNGVFEIAGPETMSLDDLAKLLMEITGHRRVIVHAPGALVRAIGALAEAIPAQIFSRDAAAFLMTDYLCDNRPLLDAFKIALTPPRTGMSYLAAGS
ncbi:MAG TPA: NAD-dependent epimerase/dehydratase family protein [Candidatus Binataceae bacterium]|nr:NAD-dependent epimerase/dehydratase family protein [Candidatus Binataceae bacterium]